MRVFLLCLVAASLGLTACRSPGPPATPTTPFSPIVSSSFRAGRYAYLGYASALTVVDLVNPAAPVPVTKVEDEGRFFGWVTVAEDHLYTLTNDLLGAAALLIYSLRDPVHPALVARYPVENALGTPALVADGLAYLNAAPGLLVLDVRDPAHPVPRGHLDVRLGSRLSKAGDRLLSTYGYCGSRNPCLAAIVTIDVRDPARPGLLAEYDPRRSYFGLELKHLTESGLAYLGGGLIRNDPNNPGVDYGLQVWNLRDPALPALQHTYTFEGVAQAADAEHVLYSRLDGTEIVGARLNPAGDLTVVATAAIPMTDVVAEAALDGGWGYVLTSRSLYDDEGYRQESSLLTLALP